MLCQSGWLSCSCLAHHGAGQQQGSSNGQPAFSYPPATRTVLRKDAVVVHDALELAGKFPDNSVHELVLQQDSFKWV